MPKAYVLLSGGVDSTCALAAANRDWDGRVAAVSVLYGQRHLTEIDHARKIAEHFENQHIIQSIVGLIQKGGLTDDSLEIPPVSYEDLPHGVSPTYVPFRNGTLLSLVAGMAAVDKEAEAIYCGVHAEDAENWAYPDCTPEFMGGMANAIYIGTYYKIRLYTPLIFMRKYEIINHGNAIGRETQKYQPPWGMTWSCYEGGDVHCGVCPTCRARKDAFNKANQTVDPTEYADDLTC